MYDILFKSLIDYNADISIVKHERIEESAIGDIALLKSAKHQQYKVQLFTPDEVWKTASYSSPIHIAGFVWDKLFKRELFNDVEFPIGKRPEDSIVFDKLLDKNIKLVYNDIVAYYYVQRKDSVAHKPHKIEDLTYVEYLIDHDIPILINRYHLHKEAEDKLYFAVVRTGTLYDKLDKNRELKERINYIRKTQKGLYKQISRGHKITRGRKLKFRLYFFNFPLFNFVRKYIIQKSDY